MEECKLIGECLNMSVKAKLQKVIFLNMHLKMYSRNGSFDIFRDASGKTINDSPCALNNELKYDEPDKYCVVVGKSQDYKLFEVKCSMTDASDLVGLICRQCSPNSIQWRRVNFLFGGGLNI